MVDITAKSIVKKYGLTDIEVHSAATISKG